MFSSLPHGSFIWGMFFFVVVSISLYPPFSISHPPVSPPYPYQSISFKTNRECMHVRPAKPSFVKKVRKQSKTSRKYSSLNTFSPATKLLNPKPRNWTPRSRPHTRPHTPPHPSPPPPPHHPAHTPDLAFRSPQ